MAFQKNAVSCTGKVENPGKPGYALDGASPLAEGNQSKTTSKAT